MRSLLAVIALATFASTAAAQVPPDVVRLELLPGSRQPDGVHLAGLRISLAPGWKTYWRAPGEAGVPPTFDWSQSSNLVSASTHFPVPDVFSLNGVRTIGYEDGVVLPLRLRPGQPDRPIELRGEVDLGVCETICIPFRARIDATLPASSGAGAAEIGAALSDTPLSAAQGEVRAVVCRLQPIADGMRLTATLDMPPVGRDEAAVIELSDPTIWVSEVASDRRGNNLTASADLVPPGGAPFALDRSSLRFTILAGGRAVEIRGCDAG